MKLTPLDIRRNEFNRSLRGYDREEVESFLTMVADEVEGLIGEHRDLTRRVEELKKDLERYRGIERTLSETLVATQSQADRTRESSERDSELTKREAKVRADQLVEGARIEAERLVTEARRQAHAILTNARATAHDSLETARAQADATYRASRRDVTAMQQQLQSIIERRDAFTESLHGFLTGQLAALETIGSERPPVVEPVPQSEMPEPGGMGDDAISELDRELAAFSEQTSPEQYASAGADEDEADELAQSEAEPDVDTSNDDAEVLVDNRPRE